MDISVQEERERILFLISFCSILTLQVLDHTTYKREEGFLYSSLLIQRLLRWLSDRDAASHAEDLGSDPGSARSPGGGNDNLLQYSSLENPIDRGAWKAAVHGVTKCWT